MSFTHIGNQISNGIFLLVVAGIPTYGMLRKVNVYETFVDGAKDGFDIAVKIIPYLVAMIVAIGMLRASGALSALSHLVAPYLRAVGMPPQVLPLALMRPFSGSGSNALLIEIIHHCGANSFAAKVAGTMMGSTETTFYVIVVYFGVVNIQRSRHAVVAGLFADFVGVVASVFFCHLLFHV